MRQVRSAHGLQICGEHAVLGLHGPQMWGGKIASRQMTVSFDWIRIWVRNSRPARPWHKAYPNLIEYGLEPSRDARSRFHLHVNRLSARLAWLASCH